MILLIVIIALSPVHIVTGTASYYSEEESGDITATGEKFDESAMTFAMLIGEFERYYLIISETGVIIARLNDRGPYIEGRVVDLTKEAMKKIGGGGLLEVSVFALPFIRKNGKICYEKCLP